MDPNLWKTIAIIFIILFLIETCAVILGYHMVVAEEKRIALCYYEICGEYVDAQYDPEMAVCYCYEQDVLGNLIVAKTKVMN